MKYIISIIFLLFPTVLIAADSYTINSGNSLKITEHAQCKDVDNQTANSIMVPTKSAVEWTSFFSNPPALVAIDACLAPAPADYIAYYTMDSISGSTLNDETSTYDLTISGATQTSSNGGVISEALTFNGTSDSVTSTAYGASIRSVSFWFYSTNMADSTVNYLFSIKDDVGTYGSFMLSYKSNSVTFGSRNGSDSFNSVTSTIETPNATWNHVAAVRDVLIHK